MEEIEPATIDQHDPPVSRRADGGETDEARKVRKRKQNRRRFERSPQAVRRNHDNLISFPLIWQTFTPLVPVRDASTSSEKQSEVPPRIPPRPVTPPVHHTPRVVFARKSFPPPASADASVQADGLGESDDVSETPTTLFMFKPHLNLFTRVTKAIFFFVIRHSWS